MQSDKHLKETLSDLEKIHHSMKDPSLHLDIALNLVQKSSEIYSAFVGSFSDSSLSVKLVQVDAGKDPVFEDFSWENL